MRQVYDERQRWPYLGNALKYFLAAQVAMFGVFHPEQRHNSVWLTSFFLATLYQCWWDVYMDWNLIDEKGNLRSKRLYHSKAFYWAIAWINLILRFCWTLSFLPLHYLNSTGVLTETFTGTFFSHILGPVIAAGEIIRRTLWGFLRFEWEAIKTSACENGCDKIYLEGNVDDANYGEDSSMELQPMVVRASREITSFGLELDPPAVTMRKGRALLLMTDMSSMTSIQVIGELAMYATTFCFFCLVVAAHRGTY